MKTFPVIYLCYCSTWRHNIFLARFFTGGYEKHKKELLRIRHAKTDFFSDNVNSSNIFLLDGNPKLFNTMTITNLTIEDDSRYGNIGSYECHELRFLISTKKNALKTDKILISGQKEFMKKMVEGWQSDHCLVTCLRSEDAKASTLDMITFTRLSVWASGLRLRKRKTSKLDVMTKETWTQNHKKNDFLTFRLNISLPGEFENKLRCYKMVSSPGKSRKNTWKNTIFFHVCLISPISCSHGTCLSRHSVRLMNVRQSLHRY